jgi:hypothetical protein
MSESSNDLAAFEAEAREAQRKLIVDLKRSLWALWRKC